MLMCSAWGRAFKKGAFTSRLHEYTHCWISFWISEKWRFLWFLWLNFFFNVEFLLKFKLFFECDFRTKIFCISVHRRQRQQHSQSWGPQNKSIHVVVSFCLLMYWFVFQERIEEVKKKRLQFLCSPTSGSEFKSETVNTKIQNQQVHFQKFDYERNKKERENNGEKRNMRQSLIVCWVQATSHSARLSQVNKLRNLTRESSQYISFSPHFVLSFFFRFTNNLLFVFCCLMTEQTVQTQQNTNFWNSFQKHRRLRM